MKHTYSITGLTAALVFCAHGMEQGPAPVDAAQLIEVDGLMGIVAQPVDDVLAEEVTVIFNPAISEGQLLDENKPRLWRYEINNRTRRACARAANSSDIPAATAYLRKLVKDLLALNPSNPQIHNQTTPDESDPHLHMAIFSGSQAYVEWLAQYDKHLQELNTKGQTPLEYAREKAELSPSSDAEIEAVCAYTYTTIAPEMCPKSKIVEMCIAAKQTSENIVAFLEMKQKEYVLECAKKMIGSMLSRAELRRLLVTKDDSLDERTSIEKCSRAMQIFLGQARTPAQLATPAAREAEHAEEKEDGEKHDTAHSNAQNFEA